jgi:hypothetical protein
MERLLLLNLASKGCAAEAVLNGIPVACTPQAGGQLSLPVHEYTLTGRNRIDLIAACGVPGQIVETEPRMAATPTWARIQLSLVRQGRSPVDPNARQLAEVAWSATPDKTFEAPQTVTREVDLPVNFPRWKWLDAPPITLDAATRRLVVEFLQQIALDLDHGHPDALLAAAKLRFDELALAYQMSPADTVQRFRDQLQRLYAAKALKVVPPLAQDVVLRPIFDGRLLDCLNASGGPLLQSQPDDPLLERTAWPARLAVVEGRIYVLR